MTRLLSGVVVMICMTVTLSISEALAQSSSDFSAGCQLLSPTSGICQSGFESLAPGGSRTVRVYGPFCFPPLVSARVSAGPQPDSPATDDVYVALGSVTPTEIGVVVTNGSAKSISGGFVGIHWVCP